MTGTRHFTAWLVNDPSALETGCMDVTVLEDQLWSDDPESHASWTSTDTQVFHAVTTVDAVDGDGQQACDEAEKLMAAAGWSRVQEWQAADNAFFAAVERSA